MVVVAEYKCHEYGTLFISWGQQWRLNFRPLNNGKIGVAGF